MKPIFALAVIVCWIFVPAFGALPVCTPDCPTQSSCPAEGEPCVCNPGYHENTAGDACVIDFQPGVTCTDSAQCVDHATCVNTAAAGQPEDLKCTCDSGYLSADGKCMAGAGTVCTTDSGGQGCVSGASCVQAEDNALKCACSEGFHEKTQTQDQGLTICEADIAVGGTCTTEGVSTECVDHATCTSVTVGDTTELKCTCDDDFHQTLNDAGKAVCTENVAAGGTCTSTDASNTECVAHAKCTSSSQGPPATLTCTCDDGYHPEVNAAGKRMCVEDVSPGGTCSAEDANNVECVQHAACKTSQPSGFTCVCNDDYHVAANAEGKEICVQDVPAGDACTGEDTTCAAHATCTNTQPEGQAAVLQCTCDDGYHSAANSAGKQVCKEDIAAGQTCPTEDSKTDCVAHATCKNSQPADQPAELKCTCDEDYHMAENDAGKQVCLADTCQDTVDKCEAAGISTCDEITAFVGCLEGGVCDSENAEELAMFKQALQDVRAYIPESCGVTGATTCTQRAASCLIVFLKETSITCTGVDALDTCLTPLRTQCLAGDDLDVITLVNAYHADFKQTFSCGCIKAINDCKDPQITILNDEASDDTAKCNAVKTLFTCALTDQCDMTKTIDQGAVSAVWSQAMASATETGCKDTITEEAATTCSLQLVRCALIYGEERETADDDRLEECKAAEVFGSCLSEKTGHCADDDATKKSLFDDQYAFVRATCTCENDINGCYDTVGVVPTDPAIACPKLARFSYCLVTPRCDLTLRDNALHQAFTWYKQKVAEYNCTLPTKKDCDSGIAACSDELISRLSREGVSGEDMCKALASSQWCVKAANCSSAVGAEVVMRETFLNGSAARSSALSCAGDNNCDSTHEAVMNCKEKYTEEFAAAANTDAQCDVKRDMVLCLRALLCNTYLKPLLESKYDQLKITAPQCDLPPLKDPNSGAALRPVFLAVLVSVLVAVLTFTQP